MLTPVDIDNKTFKKVKFGGYDINDVEEFLVEVMNSYETLYKENSELKDKITIMQESVSYYKSLEDGVSKTIENAQTAADEIRKASEREAEVIKKEARLEAEKEIEEIKEEIVKKQIELEEAKKQIQIYKIKVRSMLEAQLKIIDDED
jgi:cell division initiation protein